MPSKPMDANGTRFYLYLGYGDWSACLDATGQPLRHAWESPATGGNGPGVAWHSQRAEVTLQPRLFQFVAAARDLPPTLDQRRGAARDRYGNWYWIAESRRQILVNSAGIGITSDFWPPVEQNACPAARFGDFAPLQAAPTPPPRFLSGLTVTTEHYLVVGVLRNPTAGAQGAAGLLVFDLHAGGAPTQILWPTAIDFVPFDLAAMPGGGVCILDRENRRTWTLDRHFQVLGEAQSPPILAEEASEDFQSIEASPVHGRRGSRHPAGITLAAASALNVHDPIAIEALPDCTVLILDRDPSAQFASIYRYRFAQQLGAPVTTSSMATWIEAEKQADFRLLAHDFAFLPEHNSADGLVPDQLYVVAADGNQGFAFELGLTQGNLQLTPLAEYLPMRLFGGKGLVATGDGVYYDFGDGWLPLTAQPRPRYVERATLLTDIKDGREPNCVWHRLILDACLPPESSVLIWSRSANERRQLELDQVGWQAEPRLYLRGDGSEQPFLPAQRSARAGSWELLFQQATGRYLQLRIELVGNERVSPRLHAMRLYYPRFSYLDHYLPAVYREDSQSASFLARFLANFEGLYTALEDKIAAVQLLFDVRSAPPEVLAWLASWFGLVLDPAWDEQRRRLLIRHAMRFFQYRGTLRGLAMALRLTLDACPDDHIFAEQPLPRRGGTVRIVERFQTRSLPAVLLGDSTELRGLREIEIGGQWQVQQGGAELQRRYAEFLQNNGVTIVAGTATAPYPIQPPSDASSAAIWTQFSRQTLGFVPSTNPSDQPLWQAFLGRRYRRIGVLNAAYGLGMAQQFSDFAQVSLPTTLPVDGATLADWVQFQAIVLGMRQTAHQFSVLLPLPPAASGDNAAQRTRLELARRIIELEKPAHTTFDVKYYWALFRVGAARLGDDTLLDRGSRASGLFRPLVLGQEYLAEAYLAAGHPQNVDNRLVLGR